MIGFGELTYSFNSAASCRGLPEIEESAWSESEAFSPAGEADESCETTSMEYKDHRVEYSELDGWTLRLPSGIIKTRSDSVDDILDQLAQDMEG